MWSTSLDLRFQVNQPKACPPVPIHTGGFTFMKSAQRGMMAAGIGMAVNVLLANIKIATGILENSYALIADGIESTADIVSSMVVWTGLRISSLPADENHPYGHGKAEPLAGIIVALALVGAGFLIGVQSVREILTPHHAPASRNSSPARENRPGKRSTPPAARDPCRRSRWWGRES